MASLPCGRLATAMLGGRCGSARLTVSRGMAAASGVSDPSTRGLDGSFGGIDTTAQKPRSSAAKTKLQKAADSAKEFQEHYAAMKHASDKPFLGAKPVLLRKPHIATMRQTQKATTFVAKTLQDLVNDASEVIVVLHHDSMHSEACKGIIDVAKDDTSKAPTSVALGNDWLNTFPHHDPMSTPSIKGKLLVMIGTPGKYLAMCMKSKLMPELDDAFNANNFVVICKGACMVPLGTQMENVLGTDEEFLAATVLDAVTKKGAVAWGHGVGTKKDMMPKMFKRYLEWKVGPKPQELKLDHSGDQVEFEHLADYVQYINDVKLGSPTLPVVNYYDTGLLVSIMMGSIIESGASLLTDADGLSILRDASIGHMISKLNQLVTVPALSKSRGVYNCFIGDGACRLNGGIELAFHLMEGKEHESMINLFVFNNHKWAIEDNLVAETELEHVLYNKDFYDLIDGHPRVAVCENELELKTTLELLSKKTNAYVAGEESGGVNVIVVRGLDIEVPPLLGDLDPIRKSDEMAFMRDVLGKFSVGCERKVPIYGCSAFEYIQFLHMFMDEMPEAKKYTYICGRTDIQAAHMCGFEQPDGKCVLMINDVYGINSLGESLRMILSGFGGRQVIVMIWHPSLLKTIDNFHLHRPPMVWPSMGPELASYYIRSAKDALIVEWDGERTAGKVGQAIEAKVPLILVNMLPEQERDILSLDIRAKV